MATPKEKLQAKVAAMDNLDWALGLLNKADFSTFSPECQEEIGIAIVTLNTINSEWKKLVEEVLKKTTK